MKKRFIVLSILAAIVVIVLVVLGFHTYQKRALVENQGKESAANQATEEQTRRELEQESNFYEKLKNGFDVNILVVGNSMALSEGATSDNDWINILVQKLKSTYHVNVRYKNIASAYSGYGAGFVKLATRDDLENYDAVLICYPATEQEEDLIQYEAILRCIKKCNNSAAIISVLANSDKVASPDKTISLTDHYGGIIVNMQNIIDDGGSGIIDHEFYPNNKGYALYTENVYTAISNVIAYGKDTPDDLAPPVYEDVKNYNNCIFVPINKCRKSNRTTFIIDVNNFSGKICIAARFKKGKQVYDIYHEHEKWLTRNELSYSSDCWYDSFLFHDIPLTNNKIIFVLGEDSSIDQFLGIYLISQDNIALNLA